MSLIGDDANIDWNLDYELIDKGLSPTDAIRAVVHITRDGVGRNQTSNRPVSYFGVYRTVPPINSPLFMRKHLSGKKRNTVSSHSEIDIELLRNEASKVLGKELFTFKLLDVSFTRTRIGPSARMRKQRRARKMLSRLMQTTKDEFGSLDDPQFRDVVERWSSDEILRDLVSNEQEKNLQAKEVLRILSAGDLLKEWRAGEVIEYVETTLKQSQELFIVDGPQKYSEFNFGSGEASILRLIRRIEALPNQSLVLIEEIENGLHPLAVERLVEYLISVAARKRLQIIFTTHSEYALNPLPSEAVWCALNGRLIQGKLSVESLRALSGRIDKQLAIFVEDKFSQKWLEAMLREGLGTRFDEVGVYQIGGDGEAINIHLAHNANPSIGFKSLCFLDGDSRQPDSVEKGIFRLPGQNPELCIFETVKRTLEKNAAILTAACQRPLSCQQQVIDAVEDVATTNRDPHLLFSQIGQRIGLVSEEIVRGAFLSVWIQEQSDEVLRVSELVTGMLE